MEKLVNDKNLWVRSEDGIILGVCSGIAPIFGLDVVLLRIIWLASVLIFGFGILAYLILAISLPRVDQIEKAQTRKVLGVCARISKRYDMEVGLVRSGFLTLMLLSAGLGGIVFYVILHLIVPKEG